MANFSSGFSRFAAFAAASIVLVPCVAARTEASSQSKRRTDTWSNVRFSLSAGPVFYPLMWKQPKDVTMEDRTKRLGREKKHRSLYFRLSGRVRWIEIFCQFEYLKYQWKEHFEDYNRYIEYVATQDMKEITFVAGVSLTSYRSNRIRVSHAIALGTMFFSPDPTPEVSDPESFDYLSPVFRVGVCEFSIRIFNHVYLDISPATLSYVKKRKISGDQEDIDISPATLSLGGATAAVWATFLGVRLEL